MKKIVKYLLKHKLTIGSVESITGGLFASTLTKIPGVSQVYKGSLVTYATSIKNRVLGIPEEITNEYGVVSPNVALEMANRGREILDVDLCVSFTGNAGPSVLENKEAGTVYIGFSFRCGFSFSECLHFEGSRQQIQKACVQYVCNNFDKITDFFFKTEK